MEKTDPLHGVGNEENQSFLRWLRQWRDAHTTILHHEVAPGDGDESNEWLAKMLEICIMCFGLFLLFYSVLALLSMEVQTQILDQRSALLLTSVQHVPCSSTEIPHAGLIYLRGCRAATVGQDLDLNFPGFEGALANQDQQRVLWRRLRIWQLRRLRGIHTATSHGADAYADDPFWHRKELESIGNIESRLDVADVTLGPYKLSADIASRLPGRRLSLELLQPSGFLHLQGIYNLSTMHIDTYSYTEHGRHHQGWELRGNTSNPDEQIAVTFEAAFEDTFSVIGEVNLQNLILGSLNTTAMNMGHYRNSFLVERGSIALMQLLGISGQATSRRVLLCSIRLLLGASAGCGIWAMLWPHLASAMCCNEFFKGRLRKHTTCFTTRWLVLALLLGALVSLAYQLSLPTRVLIMISVLVIARSSEPAEFQSQITCRALQFCRPAPSQASVGVEQVPTQGDPDEEQDVQLEEDQGTPDLRAFLAERTSTLEIAV